MFLFDGFLRSCLQNKFLKFSWKALIPLLKMRQLSFLSWRLWVEGVGWIVSLGVEPRLDSHETGEISPLFPSAARPHAAIPSTSLLHFCTDVGPCRSLVHSASLAISLPVCSCSLLLLPSLFLSLVIGLVSLSRRFHSVVLRL